MLRKTPRSSLPCVHVGESDHGGDGTGRGVEEQRELIGEVAKHWLTRRELRGFCRKEILWNAQLVREKADFVLFCFEVIVGMVRDDEIKEKQARADELARMGETMTQIFAVGQAIDGP